MSLSPEQMQARSTGVGGSEVAAILGICPYRQPYDVWLEKTGRAGPVDLSGNESVFWGVEYEEPIAREYMRRKDVKVRRKNQTARHPKYDWLVANIDRDIVGVRKGLEIKNIGWRLAHLWGESGTDQAAEYYIPQPHHYMLVMDYEAWDLAAVIGGQELRVYEFERDPEMDEIIIDATHDFWHNNVLADVPPEIDYNHKHTASLLKRIYKSVEGDPVELDESAARWAAVFLESKELASKYEKAAEVAKFHLQSLVGNHPAGILPDGSGFTRKIVKRSGFTVEPVEYVDFRYKKSL